MAEGYRWRQEQRQQELTVLAWTTASEELQQEWEELRKEFGV